MRRHWVALAALCTLTALSICLGAAVAEDPSALIQTTTAVTPRATVMPVAWGVYRYPGGYYYPRAYSSFYGSYYAPYPYYYSAPVYPGYVYPNWGGSYYYPRFGYGYYGPRRGYRFAY